MERRSSAAGVLGSLLSMLSSTDWLHDVGVARVVAHLQQSGISSGPPSLNRLSEEQVMVVVDPQRGTALPA